jgi:two-component system cell cycle sensor histidine kinase/response regulator CckA
MTPGSRDGRDLVVRFGAIFWEANPETLQFTAVSPKAEALLGYSHSAWTSNPTFWADILHPDDRERALATRASAIKRCEDHHSDYRVIATDGRARWIRDTVRVKCDPGQPKRVYGVMIDATTSQEEQQREAYSAALIESERDFTSTFDQVPIGIVHIGLEGRCLRVNRHLCELLGYAPEELMNTSFTAITHPDDVEQDTRALTELVAGAIAKYEREKRCRHRDGHFVYAKMTTVLHRDSGSIPKYFISTIDDVNDRDRREGQLRQGQKMEAVGRWASGIAHDFNNLLTAVIGYSDLVLQQVAPGTPLHHDVEQIRHAGTSAEALTRQLLAFSRKQILQPQSLDLNRIVSGLSALLRRLIGEEVALVTRLAASLDRVWADPGQIEQIIVNLALNARDAMPHGGTLTVETANAELAAHPGSSEGRQVMLVIGHTGMGVDETDQAARVEPLSTVRERGNATGLGLATVYGIVKQNGGSIFVYSEPKRGTTFKIFLPRTELPADLPSAMWPATQPRGGTETILVVDDQPDVRAVTRDTLSRHGYKVLEAANGAQALSILENHDVEVRLLFTDVVMPGVSGRDFAKQLGTRRPNLRILYTSGYTDDMIVHHGILEAGIPFIQKPFTPTALLQTIRRLLDAP